MSPMLKEAYEMFKTSLPIYIPIGQEKFLSVYLQDGDTKYTCYLKDEQAKTEGVLRIKKDRLATMDEDTFCMMLNIMEKRTMKPFSLVSEQSFDASEVDR